MFGCCIVMPWMCHVCAQGMCGGGAGSCVGGRRSVRFGVIAVCGRSLEVVFACDFVPGCGLDCGWRCTLGWCVMCGLYGDRPASGGRWCGAGVVRCCSCVAKLRCPMSLGSASWCVAVSCAGRSGEVRVGGGGGCGVVRWCSVLCWLPHWAGGIVPGSGGVGGCSWCGAVPRGLLAFPLVFPGLWAVWDLCGVGLGVP